MGFQFISDYNIFWYILVAIASAGITFLMYQKNKFQQGNKWYSWPVSLLMGLRFFALFIIFLLLISPFLKTTSTDKIEPVLIYAMDNSASILANKDSAQIKEFLEKKSEELRVQLGKKIKVKSFLFSSGIEEKKGTVPQKLDFKGTETNLSKLYDEIYDRFGAANIGAVITTTDGIFNAGENPQNNANKLNAPLYFVALGDTVSPKDAIIKNVRTNKIVYSGNKFPAQIQLKINGYKGEKLIVNIASSEGNVFTQTFEINSASQYQEIDALIEAKTSGYKKYTVTISKLNGEITYQNNSYDFFIESLESKRKILIVAKAPHPDVAAIKKSIERNQDYQAKSYTLQEFLSFSKGSFSILKTYQMVMLHQIPGKGNAGLPLLNYLKENNIPYMLIVGGETDITALNNLNAGVLITPRGGNSNEVFGAYNDQFSLFTLKENLKEGLAKWPPLISPFGDYQTSSGAENVLLYQQIGKVKSNFPLLVFNKNGESKSAVLCGEGIWKWYLNDYAGDQNFEVMDEFMNKTVQYLSNKIDNRLLRARTSKNIFEKEEQISIEAEAFLPNYEPLQNAKINLSLVNGNDNTSKEYNFSASGTSYLANIGVLNSGTYRWKASSTISGKKYEVEGAFSVRSESIEFLETTADHALLRSISKQTGGEVVFLSNMESLADKISKKEDITPVLISQTDLKELIHYKWIFFLALLLLGTEWFLRKYLGGV